MAEFHALLRRQWNRHVGPNTPPETLRPFLQAVSEAYEEFDRARRLVERALALSSDELTAANAELRGVLRALPDALFRVRADNRIGDVLGGATPAHPLLQQAVEECSAGTSEFWRAVRSVREAQSPVAFECHGDGAPDQARCFELRLLPFVEQDILGIARDVTERRRAELALRESQERLALAQRAGRVGAFDWNLATNRIIWSPATETSFRQLPESIEGTYEEWIDRVVPEHRPALEATFKAWFDSGRDDEQWECRTIGRTGHEHWIESKGHLFRDASGRPLRVIGASLDITERKQAEHDRLVLGKLESTGILAGGIAHDFNNLLTGMMLNVGMAEMLGQPGTEVASRLRSISQGLAAAKILTDQLITFARGGAAVARRAPLHALVRESVELALTGSNVLPNIELPENLWPAEVDAGQIGQVVRNLVINAREAMPAGGKVNVRAANVEIREGEVANLRPGQYVHISVTDAGGGIPPDVLPSIFDPYFSTKQRGSQKGMGLGLTICHSVVKNHGGVVVAESTPGAGATISFYLPASPHAGSAGVSRAPELGSRRILVMDDDPFIRTICEGTLAHMGYRPEMVADGAAALSLYASALETGRPFDAVLLDLTVRGGMGGAEAMRALRQLHPEIRAVVMSGYSNDKVMHEYRAHGFKAVLVKPFDTVALRRTLEDVLL